MALFQKSVLKKYLKDLNQEFLNQAWLVFSAHFHNPKIQEHILNSKEEEYQEGFVRDLFVNVLGYTLKPQPNYNLVLEKKTEADATKSDGSILSSGTGSSSDQTIGVIELKDTSTTNLDKIEKQVFGYKNKHQHCKYIISANFEKLRFYINDAVEYIEFDLFKCTQEEFAILYLCLQQKNIQDDIPLLIKQLSISEEEDITKKLYVDYTSFREKLFQNLILKNPKYDKLILFKKTQTLLDRFLFILFAEDKMLLPPNSVREILAQWQQLKDLDNYVPLYERFKKYFGYLNTGHKGKSYEIFAYNGGLFSVDEILDSIQIDDDLLYDACMSLSGYNFESEVDVNILGHIFENSLNQIEVVQAEIEGTEIQKERSKRRKDGIFYTPRFITKYMVDITLGSLCSTKKEELNIIESEFTPQKRKANKKHLDQKLNEYKEWLLKLTICDPACGSGAFLNQALEFLIKEHQLIDEMKAKLFGDALILSDVEADILENNLYGVDINNEAVEIARLSLWLRTARKGRKLNNLSKNIKSGNSLINDRNVAGEKAFNWMIEFPHLASHGGFDIIIGNPPYVDIKRLPHDIVEYLFLHFKSSNNRINLFATFIECAFSILKQDAYFSFIIPSSILTQESYLKIRELLINNTKLLSIVRLPNESFGASAGEVKVDTIILTFKFCKSKDNAIELIVYKGFDRITEISIDNADNYSFVSQLSWAKDANFLFKINSNNSIEQLITKIDKDTIALSKCSDISLGITPYDKYRGHTQEDIKNRVFHSTFKKDKTFKKLLAGNDVKRYHVEWGGEEWISYGPWLGAAREPKFFLEKRILVKQIIDWSSKKIWAALTDEELYNTQNAFNIIPNDGFQVEYLIALLNSRLFTFYHKKKYLEEFKDRFQKILIKDCKEFPIKIIQADKQNNFVSLVNTMLLKNDELLEIKRHFIKLLQIKYPKISISKNLDNWPLLSCSEFLKEVSKQKIKLSISDQSEWILHFEEMKINAKNIQDTIDQLDNDLDKLVYDLYELTADEILTVEKV